MSEILIGLATIGGAIAVGTVFAWVHSRLTANSENPYDRVDFEPETILVWTLSLVVILAIAYGIGEAINGGGVEVHLDLVPHE